MGATKGEIVFRTICIVVAIWGTVEYATKDSEVARPTPMVVDAVGDGELSSSLETVKSEFSKIESQEDKEVIYTLFAGSFAYLSKCKSLDGTHQFGPLLGKVQTTYGWDREKYPAFTDAVSAYLIEVGYDKPKSLSSKSERFEFAKIFQGLAEATKHE